MYHLFQRLTVGAVCYLETLVTLIALNIGNTDSTKRCRNTEGNNLYKHLFEASLLQYQFVSHFQLQEYLSVVFKTFILGWRNMKYSKLKVGDNYRKPAKIRNGLIMCTKTFLVYRQNVVSTTHRSKWGQQMHIVVSTTSRHFDHSGISVLVHSSIDTWESSHYARGYRCTDVQMYRCTDVRPILPVQKHRTEETLTRT